MTLESTAETDPIELLFSELIKKEEVTNIEFANACDLLADYQGKHFYKYYNQLERIGRKVV